MSESQDDNTRRRIESELNKNFIVEAAAGTGKTTSLVNRMVALIETGTCRIDELAAVTFTRKAAAELKERFQAALHARAKAIEAGHVESGDRLRLASDKVNLAFVGTIHSFCAALLRERPIEFNVDPTFRELDEKEDGLLREQAWQENIADLIASKDPLLDQLRDLKIDRAHLKNCFSRFIEHRDIDHWPTNLPGDINLENLQRATKDYIRDIKELLKTFPKELDDLVNRYWDIARASQRGFRTLGDFFSLLERFASKKKGTQREWAKVPGGSKELCKDHNSRWEEFRTTFAEPGTTYWTRYRYRFVVEFLRRAVSVYQRLKQINGGLDFQDLLLKVATGLKNSPQLRTYFQSKYRNVLVDEFQDTDPLQAQMMFYLTSADTSQSDWTQCVPKTGSLFLVGDPKQSIYRFRRGDILIYNQVKEIICRNGGEVLPLVKNFRSRTELREWNNTVYREKFGSRTTAYSPAAEDMVQGREDDVLSESIAKPFCGTYRLEIPTDLLVAEARDFEAEAIAKFIRHAIDSGLEVPRTVKEIASGLKTQVQPRDFLIIPWGKKGMNAYTEALERYGVPYQVSGGNPLASNPQLATLIDCLRAIEDPTNPVHYLSVLRNFFGFSDRELYLLKQADGSFNYNHPIPEAVTSEALGSDLGVRFQAVANRFQKYAIWMRSLSYATAVLQIATDLGLISAAASTDEGNMQAGGLLKVIEWLRSQSLDFDSARDLIEFLDEVLTSEDVEACPALPPTGNVVRLMNLHKAKGLESPIVFLADTSRRYRGKVVCHIDRTSGTPSGYMGISAEVKKKEFTITKEVATPENWSTLQDEEQRFIDAEHDRLLYVATTRAACANIISVGKEGSNWTGLHPYLANAPALQIPEVSNVSTAAELREVEFKEVACISPDSIQAKWDASLNPSYSVTSAKTLGLKGSSRVDRDGSGEYGHEWGTAVHELLEVCHKTPTADLLSTATRLARDNNIRTERIPELIATVESVLASDIWKRAQAAQRCYSELPFETTDLDQDGQPLLIRGVIDLIFEEPDGWIIVDYKTDDLQATQLSAVLEEHRGQLTQYSRIWTAITSLPIKSTGLYFTRLNQYVSAS